MPSIPKLGVSRDNIPKFNVGRDNIKNPRSWVAKKDSSSSSSYERASTHQSAPLSTLRDPSEFAPPPKHVNYHGAAAAQASISNPGSPASSTAVTRTNTLSSVESRQYDTDRGGGLGCAQSQDSLGTWQQQQQQQKSRETEAAEKPATPAGPYRKDTTGLRTDHLPPPPVRRGTGVNSPASPPPVPSRSPAASRPLLPPPAPQPAKRAPPPNLPPRLPPRQTEEPTEYTPPPPPTYTEATTTTTVGTPQPAPSNPTTIPPRFPSSRSGISDLPSRFARLNTTNPTLPSSSSSSSPQPSTSCSSSGPISASSVTSAYTTLGKARRDPTSVSLSEARQAVTTAGAVNQRYGAQIGQGVGVANRFVAAHGGGGQQGAFTAGTEAGAGAGQASGVAARASGLAGGLAALNGAVGKKAPPPVPGRRGQGDGGGGGGDGGGGGADADGGTPPPVPIGSKPKF